MKKILVVDDSKTIRTMCEWIFKSLEDRILTADSAASARSVIDSESPDVVIVDYTLPDVDSYEFVSSIKTRAHVIMMGGKYAPFSEEKALASGAEGILMKPFKTDVFFKLIDDAAAGLLNSAAAEVAAPVEEPAPVAAEPIAPISSHTAVPSSSVPSIGGFVASAAAPNSSVSHVPSSPANPVLTPSATLSPSVAPISSHTAVPAANPFAGAKRFNFPTSNSAVSERPSQSGTPAAPLSSPAIALTPATSASNMQPRVESSTPKTPVPSVSPAVQAAQAESAQNVQIDPAVLRAEVVAAVKQLLPAIVNSYLKKLIQAEVKPQLQNWVDVRVESLIKKMNNQQ